ncbi:putative membrane protein [Microcystis aeruginosa TAIHU98]|uniref:Putative membrane protein n=1 Tax=Microcystis aeruginosa TAIHU98 TaxID=1134457 RepID=L7EEW4_MICAE|nr:putative membrane protein [Microcystis aeruginosa TAIHU98]ODV35952.1 hypothetical protein BFG60_4702 [Microcystis aeruginosa NIES-98]
MAVFYCLCTDYYLLIMAVFYCLCTDYCLLITFNWLLT